MEAGRLWSFGGVEEKDRSKECLPEARGPGPRIPLVFRKYGEDGVGYSREETFGYIFLWFSEDGDYIFHIHDKELVVTLEIDGDGAFGIKEDLVVLLEGQVG